MSTRSEHFKKFWAGRRAQQDADLKQGIVTIRLKGSRLHVAAPFRVEYVNSARQFGRWKPASRIWTFPATGKQSVIDLCERVYGKEAIRLVGFPAE